MLATIFEMIEKILGFAGASFDAQAIVKAIFDAAPFAGAAVFFVAFDTHIC